MENPPLMQNKLVNTKLLYFILSFFKFYVILTTLTKISCVKINKKMMQMIIMYFYMKLVGICCACAPVHCAFPSF